jgi:hypothetical protein
LQIDCKKTLSCIDRQRKSFNTNIAKVQAQNVICWPLDDVELVDWTTTNKFARLWFCENIHYSSILKLAIKKAIQKSPNWNLSSKLFEDDSNNEKISLLGLCLHTNPGTLLTSFHNHRLLFSILICRRTQLWHASLHHRNTLCQICRIDYFSLCN